MQIVLMRKDLDREEKMNGGIRVHNLGKQTFGRVLN